MRRLVRMVAVAVVAVLTLSACDFSVYSLPLPGGADLGDSSYAVKVQFRDVLDLVPQSAVKVDDVTVGKVEDVSLDGYTALVTLRLNGKVKLPENSLANIRQTSLLGEKFISLSPPVDEPPTGRLADGDTIPLSHSGRNPEVEEVLAALSLLLNGGGVAQLKTISQELNKAMSGNETEIRSVLGQLDEFMGQLDKNKHDIIAAIRSINALALEVKQQKSSIINTLNSMPQALRVLNQQRSGLVKMLQGLKRLSPVAVHVIKASKQYTIADLRALDPILTKLADAGSNIPKALQLFLTYPFVNATIGNTVTEARNLHMGDYTNLSAQLNINLNDLVTLPPLPNPCDLLTMSPLPTIPSLPVSCTIPTNLCDVLGGLPTPSSIPGVTCSTTPPIDVCSVASRLLDTCPTPVDTSSLTTVTSATTVINPVVKCLKDPTVKNCAKQIRRFCENHPHSNRCQQLVKKFCGYYPDSKRCDSLITTVCDAAPLLPFCPTSGGGGGVPIPSVPIPGLSRVAPNYSGHSPPRVETAQFDEDLALLLMQGVSR